MSSHCRQIPTFADINVHDSLEEQAAAASFLGKSLTQAEAMFRSQSILNAEHLMWMGPSAFCFYIVAAVQYLVSDASIGDVDGLSAIAAAMEFQNKFYANYLVSVADYLVKGCDIIESKWAARREANVDNELARFRTLRRSFGSMIAESP